VFFQVLNSFSAGAPLRALLEEFTTLPQTSYRLGMGTPPPHTFPLDAGVFGVSISAPSAPWLSTCHELSGCPTKIHGYAYALWWVPIADQINS